MHGQQLQHAACAGGHAAAAMAVPAAQRVRCKLAKIDDVDSSPPSGIGQLCIRGPHISPHDRSDVDGCVAVASQRGGGCERRLAAAASCKVQRFLIHRRPIGPLSKAPSSRAGGILIVADGEVESVVKEQWVPVVHLQK